MSPPVTRERATATAALGREYEIDDGTPTEPQPIALHPTDVLGRLTRLEEHRVLDRRKLDDVGLDVKDALDGIDAIARHGWTRGRVLAVIGAAVVIALAVLAGGGALVWMATHSGGAG